MQLGTVEICMETVICAVGNDSGEIMYKKSFSVSTYENIMITISEYFKTKHIKGLGVIVHQSIDKNVSQFDWKTNLQELFKIPIALNFNIENDYVSNDKTIISALILARDVA